MVSGRTKLVGLLGYPVQHTLSPSMHNPAFQSVGLNLLYVPLEVHPKLLEKAVEGLRAMNFVGANVTIPHKENVIPFLDEISEESKKIGAVNTIVNRDGRLLGTTTDPEGFLAGFQESGGDFRGKKVAIIGTGGSARTILYSLLLHTRPEAIDLVGRNAKQLAHLEYEIKTQFQFALQTVDLSQYTSKSERYDIVVQATSVGMTPNSHEIVVPEESLHTGQIVYDIVYTPERTRLIAAAQRRGLQTVGGLGMLVHQGVASFRLWTGKSPDPELFYRNLRRSLNANHEESQ